LTIKSVSEGEEEGKFKIHGDAKIAKSQKKVKGIPENTERLLCVSPASSGTKYGKAFDNIMSPKKFNILYLIGSLNSGGAERQLVELVKALDKSMFRPFIVIYHNIIYFREILDEKDVTVKVIDKKFKLDPTFPFKLARFVKDNKIDIIHAYSESAAFWSRIAGKLTGTKTTAHIQNTKYSPGWFRLERLMGWMDECIIANSYSGRDEYMKNIEDRELEVIQNGLNFDLIPDRPALSKEDDGLKIISIGRISKQKNYMCLLRAVKLIRDKISGLSVDIWGRIMHRDKYDEMMEFIEKNDLSGIIKYRGTSEKVIKEIASADLLVMSSLWEGFPNVVMESLACGTPVIASNVADMRYLVEPGETGFLFPSNDHRALAEKIMEFISLAPPVRQEMGEAGKSHIKKNYSIEIMARKTGQVYEKIMNG